MRLGPDGASQLETWRLAASRGSEASIKKLEGPPFPEVLRYLWGWSLELFGKSGIGQHGVGPLTYTTLWHWADLTGRMPRPREVDALMRLDTALRSTGSSDPEPEQMTTPDWPEKKPDG